ncbi:MAG TPA: hypothetical protein VFF73_16320, partial [Planctomycetota bacterium]|nr:hypothetical protein [Planctomycetota bacterium]
GLAAPNIGRPHTGAATRLPNATDIETNGYSSIFMRLGAERGRGTLWLKSLSPPDVSMET